MRYAITLLKINKNRTLIWTQLRFLTILIFKDFDEFATPYLLNFNRHNCDACQKKGLKTKTSS